jgi:hypothetical protein
LSIGSRYADDSFILLIENAEFVIPSTRSILISRSMVVTGLHMTFRFLLVCSTLCVCVILNSYSTFDRKIACFSSCCVEAHSPFDAPNDADIWNVRRPPRSHRFVSSEVDQENCGSPQFVWP